MCALYFECVGAVQGASNKVHEGQRVAGDGQHHSTHVVPADGHMACPPYLLNHPCSVAACPAHALQSPLAMLPNHIS